MKKKRFLPDKLAVYGGLALLLLLGVAAFVYQQDFSVWERRYLAEKPNRFDLVDWQFNNDLETYLSDHIPFRRALINVHSSALAITGRAVQLDAWPLIRGGQIVFQEKPVSASVSSLESRMRALDNLAGDIPHWFLTPPTPGSLAGSSMTRVRKAAYDNDAALYQAYEAHDNAVSLFSAFSASYDTYYYRTDHHWTLEGAWRAYQAYCEAVGLESAEKEDFRWVTGDSAPAFFGTTYSRSGLPFAAADRLSYAEPLFPAALYIADDDTQYDHLIFPQEAETYDGYAIYLKGNHGYLEILNPQAQGGTLFVCKDSFANCLLPFLAKHYAKVVAVDARYYAGSFYDAMEQAGQIDQILFLYSMDSLAADTSIVRKARR